jgi:hypothetical protein
MATNTPNANLKKPQDTDNADLKIFVGENMDIIDTELAKRLVKDETTGKLKVADLPIASATTLGGVKVGTGLSIDANGVLTASGGTGGTIFAFHSYQTTAQAFSAGVWTKVSFEGMMVNVNGNFDLTTDEFTAPEAGVYNIGGSISWGNGQLDGNRTVMAYYKNGVSAGWIADISAGKAGQSITTGNTIVALNAGDKLSLYVYTVGANSTQIVSGNALTYFYGYKLT